MVRNEFAEQHYFKIDIELENLEPETGRLIGDLSIRTKTNSIFKKGDILFGRLRPYLKKWHLTQTNGLKSGEIWAFYSTDEFCRNFIYLLVQTENFLKIANISAGTKMPRADWNLISQMSIFVPTLPEQQAIGEFFKQLDDTIAFHQRTQKKYQNLKKSYLEKMFAKINYAWKQRKLGDCFFERVERSDKGELISVTINSGVIKSSDLDRKDNSSKDKSNYKKVEINDIAYNSMRMWQGASGVSAYSGILSPAYTVLVPNEGISSLFFSYQFKLEKMLDLFRVNSQGLTSDTWNLKYPLIKNIEVFVPTLPEQQAIGEFFRQLDDTIAFHQRELEKYQQLKQVLLDQLFV